MGNYKRSRRRKLVRGSSVLRVFGSSYHLKDEAREEEQIADEVKVTNLSNKLQLSIQFMRF